MYYNNNALCGAGVCAVALAVSVRAGELLEPIANQLRIDWACGASALQFSS